MPMQQFMLVIIYLIFRITQTNGNVGITISTLLMNIDTFSISLNTNFSKDIFLHLNE